MGIANRGEFVPKLEQMLCDVRTGQQFALGVVEQTLVIDPEGATRTRTALEPAARRLKRAIHCCDGSQTPKALSHGLIVARTCTETIGGDHELHAEKPQNLGEEDCL
jgi:hypothetical protein